MSKFFDPLTEVDVSALALYQPTPQIDRSSDLEPPLAIIFVNEAVSNPIFVSFDGTTDHLKINPKVNPVVTVDNLGLDGSAMPLKMWFRGKAAVAGSVCVVMIQVG